jgi:hypothetical protein
LRESGFGLLRPKLSENFQGLAVICGRDHSDFFRVLRR